MKRKASQCPIVTNGIRCKRLSLQDKCREHRKEPNTKYQPLVEDIVTAENME